MTLDPIEVEGDAESDARLTEAARRYVQWLLETGQAWRLANEPALTSAAASRILGHGRPVDSYGLGVTLATPFGGGTLAVGFFQIEGAGSGMFVSFGMQQGLDASVSFFHAVSTNLEAFGGESSGPCVSLFAEACRFTNAAGETVTGGASFGIPTPWYVGGNAGTITTVFSEPTAEGLCYSYGPGLSGHVYRYRC